MRLAAYAGASTALAGAVVLRAFTERPNFYSAAVYLGQSNACRMILMNFLLLSSGSILYALQRILYGPLRPREVEVLWDNGWYAVTETALAMTTFRDEVGGWFFILFMSLLAGKVWGWIGAGRLEYLEQQPPANPRLFHARLTASLVVSELFNVLMLQYCVRTLQEQPRPGMMVMFAFEFAVLVITSSSTLARYALILRETVIIRQQTQAKVEEMRNDLRQQARTAETPEAAAALQRQAEGEIDDSLVDVPGWLEKGRWMLGLDLATDFLKLVLYMGFFFILLVFSGIPLHMFRDLYLTMKSFFKRISDYLKYRHATKDMNSRYPDATAEELERDGTCIICREDMQPWQPQSAATTQPTPSDERQRPKKLPCGHILHVGCLRSWLERQQVCPTCRAPVVVLRSRSSQQANANGNQPGANGNQANQNAPGENQQGQPGQRNNGVLGADRRNNAGLRARTWGFGNFRFTLAAGDGGAVRRALREREQVGNNSLTDDLRALLENMNRLNPRDYRSGASIREDLDTLERRLNAEIESLQTQRHRLAAIRALQTATEAFSNLPDASEAERQRHREQLRAANIAATRAAAPTVPASATGASSASAPASAPQPDSASIASAAPASPAGQPSAPQGSLPGQAAQSSSQTQTPLTPGHAQLPPGLVLPEGWTLTPLPAARTPYRMGAPMAPPIPIAHNAFATRMQFAHPPQFPTAQAQPNGSAAQAAALQAQFDHVRTTARRWRASDSPSDDTSTPPAPPGAERPPTNTSNPMVRTSSSTPQSQPPTVSAPALGQTQAQAPTQVPEDEISHANGTGGSASSAPPLPNWSNSQVQANAPQSALTPALAPSVDSRSSSSATDLNGASTAPVSHSATSEQDGDKSKGKGKTASVEETEDEQSDL